MADETIRTVFTGQERVYCIKPQPAEVLGIVFDSLTQPISSDPRKIAQVLVSNRSLSCLAPLFTNTEDDDAAAENRVTDLVQGFISSEQTEKHLLVSNGVLAVQRKEPDLAKPNLPGASHWASSASSLLQSNCRDAFNYQIDLLRKTLQVSQ